MQTKISKEWRVPIFDSDHSSTKKYNRKRKKTSNLQPLLIVNDNISSATEHKDNMINESQNFDRKCTSPVLNNRYGSDDETSPVIDTNKHKFIKLRKTNLSNKPKCVRKLTDINEDNITENPFRRPKGPNEQNAKSKDDFINDLTTEKVYDRKYLFPLKKKSENYECSSNFSKSSCNKKVNSFGRQIKNINTTNKMIDNDMSKFSSISMSLFNETGFKESLVSTFELKNDKSTENSDIFASQFSSKIETSQSPIKLTQETQEINIDIFSTQTNLSDKSNDVRQLWEVVQDGITNKPFKNSSNVHFQTMETDQLKLKEDLCSNVRIIDKKKINNSNKFPFKTKSVHNFIKNTQTSYQIENYEKTPDINHRSYLNVKTFENSTNNIENNQNPTYNVHIKNSSEFTNKSTSLFDIPEFKENLSALVGFNNSESCGIVEEINPCESPEIFESQLSLKIESSQSPKKLSQDTQKISIDMCSSQDSSIVTISMNSPFEEFQEQSAIMEPAYLEKQKKKYKSGTLAQRLQKLLQKQKNEVAIWKHEIYLSSTTDFQVPTSKEEHLIMSLKVLNKWNSFGCVILECTDTINTNKCVVVVDINYIQQVILDINSVIKIYPPYFVKILQFCNNIKTYVNVHKIL